MYPSRTAGTTGGRTLFDARAERVIRSTPGVAEAEPVLNNAVELASRERSSFVV